VGVANTGTSPLPTLAAVSASVTLYSATPHRNAGAAGSLAEQALG
jgi:hypothetical protein